MPHATLHDHLLVPLVLMPPEHQRHTQTLTAWPDRASQPDSSTLSGAERDIAALSQAIAHFEPVTLYCRPNNLSRAQKLLAPTHQLEIRPLAVDELWIRDTGPVYVQNTVQKSLAGLDLNFNYWGNKYTGTVDGAVANLILADQNVPRLQAPFTAEGGAIEVDGEGTLMLTESSVLNENRNPGVSKAALEEQLKETLGVSKVIWLPGTRGQDITDGHVDGLARFVAPGQIVLSRPHMNASAVAKQVYEEAKRVLLTETDACGRRFQIEDLTEADPTLFQNADDYQLCLSYVNYLVVNAGIVMPSFGDVDSDETALQIMRRLFPGRKIEQVLLTTICRLGGGIHCATQQVPRLWSSSN